MCFRREVVFPILLVAAVSVFVSWLHDQYEDDLFECAFCVLKLEPSAHELLGLVLGFLVGPCIVLLHWLSYDRCRLYGFRDVQVFEWIPLAIDTKTVPIMCSS